MQPQVKPSARFIRLTACAAVVVAVATTSACTSSGSGGSPTVPATSTHSTAKTSTNPSTVNSGTVAPPKHVLVLQHVSAEQAKKLEQKVVHSPGVQSVGYVPTTKSVDVYFVKSAGKKQRAKAKKLAHEVLHRHQS